jgi:ABC-2 type transport system permease protein
VRLTLVHARTSTLELLRHPGFCIPTLALPAIFFAFFAIPRGADDANVLVASFAAYAAVSVAFFQFGVGIAAERARPWEQFLRTLPVGVGTRLGARAISALAFATASLVVLLAVAVPATSPDLSASQWSALGAALLLGLIPFTLLGITLGYWLSPKAALPVANILYLTLAYAGGLWTGPTGLPHVIDAGAAWLPTRQWGEALWNGVRGPTWDPTPWLVLVAYTAIFGVLAVWGYRRDEGRRYR